MVGLRACLLLLLAMILMILDHHSTVFHRFRENFSIIVLPIQAIVDKPIQWVHWLSTGVLLQQHLLKENAQLRAYELLLQSKLHRLTVLNHENKQLRALLKSSAHVAGKVKIAQLLAIDLDPAIQQIIIDKGYHDHVYVGQPVLDAYGVIGQVVDVGPLMSKVLLLTNHRFAIPVKDQRNGFRALARGEAAQKLTLLYVNDKKAIRVGDVFVTSGLGLHFPMGYPVGIVSAVQQISGERFIKVTLVPLAHFSQTQQVILVWSDQAALTKAVKRELHQPIPTVS